MNAPPSRPKSEPTLAHDLFALGRYYLGNRRAIVVAAGLVLTAGLALNWNWLAAAGIAPILIAVLPCLGMCALGLCMGRGSARNSVPMADYGDEGDGKASSMFANAARTHETPDRLTPQRTRGPLEDTDPISSSTDVRSTT